MKYLVKTYVVLIALAFTGIFYSCEKDEEVQPGDPPTADAGIDQDAVVGSTVTLNGTGTDPDDDELAYSWAITTSPSGSSATLTNPNSKNASFVPDVAGSYTVTLAVSDGVYDAVTDEIIITVVEAEGSPPVAVIHDENGSAVSEDNENNSITITQTYVLDGSASTDPDEDQLSFQWTIVSQPDGSNPEINNDTNAEAGFVPDVPGEYILQLEVTDPNDNSNATQVTIIAKADPMVIDSDINENTTLEDIFEDSDMPDYIVTANVDVNAELTVAPGVIVHFEQNRLLTVTRSGMINAEGTTDNSIVFTSANVAGEIRWKGILVNSSDARNIMSNVEISWAGSEEILHSSGWKTAALAVGDEGKLKLNNTTISKSSGYGLFVHVNGELGEFSANSFEDNEGYPVGLYAAQAGSMDGATTFSGNKEDVVVINKSTLSSDSEVQWSALNNARYHLSGNLTIEALLRIEEGAQFESEQDVKIVVDTDGALIAKGTASNQIVFTTANESGQIHWSGIIFNSADARNELDYVTVSWAASNDNFYYSGWQYVSVGLDDNAKATITNSTISNSNADGIYVHKGAEVSFSDLTFDNIQGRPVVLSANQAAEVNEGFQFSNNAQNVIAIYKSNFTNTENNTWVTLSGDAYYLVMSEVQVKEALTVNAGATLKFTSNASLIVNDSGALSAEGTENEMITFTAVDTDDKWKGIAIETNNANNKLNYCEVSYAGNDEILYSGGWRTANVALNGTLEIQNSVITNGSGTGLYISNSSTVNGMLSTLAELESTLLSENTFTSNAGSALTIQ